MKPFNNHSPLPWEWKTEIKTHRSGMTQALGLSFQDGLVFDLIVRNDSDVPYLSSTPSEPDRNFILHAVNTYYETRQLLDSVNEINRELTDALEKLYDVQNGAPLIKDHTSWEEAMLLSKKAIDKSKGERS